MASPFPCPVRIDCPGTDNPFANLSAEGPDRNDFIAWFTGFPWLFPPLGSNWTAISCTAFCTSEISQEDADSCAQINNTVCLFNTWGPPGEENNGGPSSGPPLIPPPFTPATVFLNQATSCTLACPDGMPFTFAIRAGAFAASSLALADSMAHSYACRLAAANAVCLSTLSTKACSGSPYSAAITPSRAANYTWGIVSGELPPGLELAAGPSPTGLISGTPTTIGSYTFAVRAQSTGGNFMVKTYMINVFGITNDTALTAATQNAAYTFTFVADGGIEPFVFAVELGTLPAGLTLATDGTLSGTPTESGDFAFTVSVTDAGSNFCTKEFTLHCEPQVCPTVLADVDGGGAGSNGWAIYAETSDAIHPNKVFFNRAVNLDLRIVDADTNALYGTIAMPLNNANEGGAYEPVSELIYLACNDTATSSVNYFQVVDAKNEALGVTFNEAVGQLFGYKHARNVPDLGKIVCFGDNDGSTGAGSDIAQFVPGVNVITRWSCTVAPGGIQVENTRDWTYCNANGRIYVANNNPAGDNFVRGYNATTHALEVSANFGQDAPRAVLWVPAVSRLFIFLDKAIGNSVIVVYDVSTDTIETSIDTGSANLVGEMMEFWISKGLMMVPQDVTGFRWVNVSANTILCTTTNIGGTNILGAGSNTTKFFAINSPSTHLFIYH